MNTIELNGRGIPADDPARLPIGTEGYDSYHAFWIGVLVGCVIGATAVAGVTMFVIVNGLACTLYRVDAGVLLGAAAGLLVGMTGGWLVSRY